MRVMLWIVTTVMNRKGRKRSMMTMMMMLRRATGVMGLGGEPGNEDIV